MEKPAPSCSHEVDRNIAPETWDLHLSNENLRSLDNEYSSEGEDWLALAPWYIGGGAEVHSIAWHSSGTSAAEERQSETCDDILCTFHLYHGYHGILCAQCALYHGIFSAQCALYHGTFCAPPHAP